MGESIGQQRVEFLRRDLRMQHAVDRQRRRLRAQSEAVDRFERDGVRRVRIRGIAVRCVEPAARAGFSVRGERFAAHATARFGAAHLDRHARGRRGAEVVIVGQYAVHFRARQVQRPGERRDTARRHVARVVLDRMKDRDQRPAGARMALDERVGRMGIRGHRLCSSKVSYALTIHIVCIATSFRLIFINDKRKISQSQ
ncbi:hypothetical protein EMIT0111MI5_160088 [Burkholderia sp. IT-111MI5]